MNKSSTVEPEETIKMLVSTLLSTPDIASYIEAGRLEAPSGVGEMKSNDVATEAALLEIAKDLLQASDGLASTDPSGSAKLAHEAYEIARDLGQVRERVRSVNHVKNGPSPNGSSTGRTLSDRHAARKSTAKSNVGEALAHTGRDVDDEGDEDLLRILDHQKTVLPKPVDMSPVRTPSRSTRPVNAGRQQSRRSGWLGWMRSREWRQAG